MKRLAIDLDGALAIDDRAIRPSGFALMSEAEIKILLDAER